MSEASFTAGEGTATFTRSVTIRDGEQATASMSVKLHFDPNVSSDHHDSLMVAAKDAFYQSKALLFAELGIEFTLIEGVVMESVQSHFKGATEVKAAPAAAKGKGGTVITRDVPCECGNNQFFDNRAKKAAGEFKGNAPDYRCTKCPKGVWE